MTDRLVLCSVCNRRHDRENSYTVRWSRGRKMRRVCGECFTVGWHAMEDAAYRDRYPAGDPNALREWLAGERP